MVWGLTSRPPVPPAGFPPVSRLPAGFSPSPRLPLVSRRPAFSGLSPSAVARFRCPFGVPPGSLPLSNLHDSATAGRFRRRWSRAARAKVTSPAATPRLDLAVIRPELQTGSGWAQWDAATESPVTSGRERRTPPRPNNPDRRISLVKRYSAQTTVRDWTRWLRAPDRRLFSAAAVSARAGCLIQIVRIGARSIRPRPPDRAGSWRPPGRSLSAIRRGRSRPAEGAGKDRHPAISGLHPTLATRGAATARGVGCPVGARYLRSLPVRMLIATGAMIAVRPAPSTDRGCSAHHQPATQRP